MVLSHNYRLQILDTVGPRLLSESDDQFALRWMDDCFVHFYSQQCGMMITV